MPFVVIRLRSSSLSSPSPEPPCIHLSPLSNTLTVHPSPPSKTQQDFTFDLLATQSTSQSSLFSSLSPSFLSTIQLSLTSSQYRMDHLVMAYGQSGSGKSYTMFGEGNQGGEGVLPRLVDRLNQDGYELGLRAFEIYNEQLYDLLTNGKKEKEKVIEIKQDLSLGVHITNLETIPLSPQKPSFPFLNSILSPLESRKSHKILTLLIRHTLYHPTKQLRLHFLQLASCDGQREYFTRRPSISINKSLTNLNTILASLMEGGGCGNMNGIGSKIGKEKKYAPWRQSKLTFFLKDMLSASGSMKWVLGNVFGERGRLRESINTLMFAKRAKCLGEGGEREKQRGDMDGEKTTRRNVRQEVRMIREELENSRFIHKSIDTEWEYQFTNSPKNKDNKQDNFRSPLKTLPLSPSYPLLSNPNTQTQPSLQTLLQNQTNFRQIFSLYQSRITLLQSKTNKKQIVKGIYNEKRLLENLNHKYARLVLNFPGFAKIIAENQELKQEVRKKNNLNDSINSEKNRNKNKEEIELEKVKKQLLSQQSLLSQYQSTFQSLSTQFHSLTHSLLLSHQTSHPSTRQLITLQNQNDCLKLSILTYQEEIERLHQEYEFVSLEIRAITEENRQLIVKNKKLEDMGGTNWEEKGLMEIVERLKEIKKEVEKEQHEMDNLIVLNRQLQAKLQQNLRFKPLLQKSFPSLQLPKTPSSKQPSQPRHLRKLLSQSQSRHLLLQKQLFKLSSRVAQLTRELTLSNQSSLCLFQQLTNTGEKLKLMEMKQKVQGEKIKQQVGEIGRLRKELEKWRIGEKEREKEKEKEEQYISNKRLSMARKGRSELEGITNYTSCKEIGRQKKKGLNTTVIVSCEKLIRVGETMRLSSGRKGIGQAREFRKEKEKEKEKDQKPLFFKSKEIKNSIVLKS